MTKPRTAFLLNLLMWGAGFAILAAALWPFLPGYLKPIPDGSYVLRAPDWALLARQPAAVLAHVGAAVFAFSLGLFLLLRRKGTGMHKTFGWIWVTAMAVTAGSSLFITGINGNSYSPIHLLSGWTLFSLPMAVLAIRRGKVGAHRSAMMSLFLGGLVLAGGLAFLPGRLMWRLFFG